MVNLNFLRHLRRTAKALGLTLPDTSRWLWSYYGTRLPGARSRATTCAEIGVRLGWTTPLRIRIRNNAFDYDVVEEIFARNAYKIDLENVGRILDLGGNIGIASLFLSRRYPEAQICAVEPISSNLELLERNMKINHVPVRIVPGAVGARDGKISFTVSQDPRQHSSEMTGISVLPTGNVTEVDMFSVPTLMKIMQWDAIDLLKIDIEGGEVEVLAGRPEWLKNVRAIIGEGHVGVGYTIEACRKDLEPMGFRVTLLDTRPGASMLFFAHRQD